MIFGFLLIMAILFIPYNYTSTTFKIDSYGNKVQYEEKKIGYMFVLRYLKKGRSIFLIPDSWVNPEVRDNKTDLFEELDSILLFKEVASIILSGCFAYILFCVVLRKSEKRGEK